MLSMSIDNELLRSLSRHPATGPRLVEYVVTGKWAKPKADLALADSDAPASGDRPPASLLWR